MVSGFQMGSYQIDGNLILAPMDGFTDQPFRWLCRRMGSTLTFSEFINVLDVPKNLNYIEKRTLFSENERPFGFQIYGSEPENIFRAAEILINKKPDFLDLNLGCSVQRVVGRGAGAGLLQFPEKIDGICFKVKRILNIPITAKIRLGWSVDTLNYIKVAKAIENAGASLITVHARARDQNWKKPAFWPPIREIVNSVKIPVIGNGDIQSYSDSCRMITETGCDAVMIGRAAIGNPWIFSKLKKESIPRDEILRVVALHWQLMIAFYGPNKASIWFKKHLKAYLLSPQFSDVDLKSLISMRNPMQHELFRS